MRVSPYRSPFYWLFFAYVAGLLWAEIRSGGAAWPSTPYGTAYGDGREALVVGRYWWVAGLGGLSALGWLCAGRGRSVPQWRAIVAAGIALLAGYGQAELSRAAGGRLPADCMDGRRRDFWVEVLDFGKVSAKSCKKTVRVLAVWEPAGVEGPVGARAEDGGGEARDREGGESIGCWRPLRATCCLYFQKEEEAAALAPGDRLAVRAAPRPLSDSDPAYAGYVRYMRRNYIYATAYVPRSAWSMAGEDAVAGVGRHPAHPLRRAAGRLQARLAAGLQHPDLGERESGIAKALIFGDKSDLNPDVQQAYRHAGVVHVLCVSGMHLGVMAMVLGWLLRFLSRVRGGRWLRFALVCLFLWGYALLTGLSASVCRAACMFTFVQAGLCFGRRLPVERSLVLSAWLLLWLRPAWLFDLGFLLSYLAVWGIVMLTPRVWPRSIESRRPLKQAVNLSAVSWAAQCATGPLCIRSFGQFPVYFWVANLLVAPMATAVLPLGLAVSLWRLATPMADNALTCLMMKGLHYGIAWMNGISLWIERWPGAVWTVGLSDVACLGCYALLLLARQAWRVREKRNLAYIGLLLWSLCCLA